MRKLVFKLISKSDKRDISYLYDIFISFIAMLSILPLMFKRQYTGFILIEKYTVIILGIDYILRLIVSDYIVKKGKISFIIYPLSIGAMVDLISLLPIGRIFRVFRIFKMLRYMSFFLYIINVYNNVKDILFTVLLMAVSYIFVTALFMFNAEGSNFSCFFDALYWATTALTTVGYGDIYPKTMLGRIISMVTSIFGIAIIALPSGIITANIIKEISKK